jgi:acyl carrier protein
LERIIQKAPTQVVVMQIDWRHLSVLYSGLSRSSIFDGLATGRHGGESPVYPGALTQFADAQDRYAKVLDYLSDHVGALLGVAAQGLDQDKPISQLGFDSLMAVQLKNKMEKELGVAAPMAALLAGPTITELTSSLLTQLASSTQNHNKPTVDDDSEEGEL